MAGKGQASKKVREKVGVTKALNNYTYYNLDTLGKQQGDTSLLNQYQLIMGILGHVKWQLGSFKDGLKTVLQKI